MPRAKSPQSNRTDLPGKVPIATSPGQQYGKRTSQEQAQRIAPVSAPPAATAGGGTTAPSPAPTAPAQPDFAAMLAGSPTPAGSLGALAGPTERPGVPVTNGLPTGPGPGPEALTGFAGAGARAVADQGSVKNLLSSLAAQPGSSTLLKQLAASA